MSQSNVVANRDSGHPTDPAQTTQTNSAKQSNGRHDGSAGAQHNSENSNSTSEPDGGYPEQKHAGAVGYGPEYGKGPSGTEQLKGWEEEIVGKLTHNHTKYQHGKDLRTGELKRREREEDSAKDPFATSGDHAQKPAESQSKTQSHHESQEPESTGTRPATQPGYSKEGTGTENLKQAGVSFAADANVGRDDKGAKEQAATVSPGGTTEAKFQRKGETSERSKQIG